MYRLSNKQALENKQKLAKKTNKQELANKQSKTSKKTDELINEHWHMNSLISSIGELTNKT